MNINTTAQAIRERNANVVVSSERSVKRALLMSVRSGRLLQVISNVDMRNGVEGLRAIALKEGKINVAELRPGQYVVFINADKKRVKVFAAFGIVAQWNAPAGEKVDLSTIQRIPRAFMSRGGMTYDDTLKETLELALAKRVRTKVAE